MGCRTHPVFAYLHVHVFCLLLSVVLVLLFAIAYSLKQQPSIDLRSHSLYNNHNITATNSSTHYMVNFQNLKGSSLQVYRLCIRIQTFLPESSTVYCGILGFACLYSATLWVLARTGLLGLLVQHCSA